MNAKALVSWLTQIPGDAVAVENGAGQLVFVSDALSRLLGYEPGELVGQHWTVLLPEQTKAADGPHLSSQTHLCRKQGGPVAVLVTGWRLPISGGVRQRRLSIFVLNGLQCSPAQSGGKEGGARRSYQLASIIHELNNALTIIHLQSQMLSRLDATSQRFGQHLEILLEQVVHMKRIVAELRQSSDVADPWLEATDINALIRHTLGIQELQLQLANVQVITDLVPDLPRIQANPHRLEQVFVNLVNNACQVLADANPPRVLWVSTRMVHRQNGHPSKVRISFANNGPAIPRELLSRIFEPFFTTKEPDQGSGLGLPICARIVQEHRGCIWAESEGQNGAVFVIELPTETATEIILPPPSAACPAKADRAATFGRSGPHILIVDGGPDVSRSVQQLLRQASFDVVPLSVGTHQGGFYLSSIGGVDEAHGGLLAFVARRGRA